MIDDESENTPVIPLVRIVLVRKMSEAIPLRCRLCVEGHDIVIEVPTVRTTPSAVKHVITHMWWSSRTRVLNTGCTSRGRLFGLSNDPGDSQDRYIGWYALEIDHYSVLDFLEPTLDHFRGDQIEPTKLVIFAKESPGVQRGSRSLEW